MKTAKIVIHTHHISTHFTNGLFPVSSILLTLFLITPKESFESASFYCAIFGTLGIFPTYFSGIYDWKTRFKGRKTKIFNRKTRFGLLLLLLGITFVFWRLADSQIMYSVSMGKIVFVAINYALSGLAGYLGYLGGKFI